MTGISAVPPPKPMMPILSIHMKKDPFPALSAVCGRADDEWVRNFMVNSFEYIVCLYV
jgi:hypothetical protein